MSAGDTQREAPFVGQQDEDQEPQAAAAPARPAGKKLIGFNATYPHQSFLVDFIIFRMINTSDLFSAAGEGEAPVDVAAAEAVPGKLTDLSELSAAPATKIVDRNSWDAVACHCLPCLAASMSTVCLQIKAGN